MTDARYIILRGSVGVYEGMHDGALTLADGSVFYGGDGALRFRIARDDGDKVVLLTSGAESSNRSRPNSRVSGRRPSTPRRSRRLAMRPSPSSPVWGSHRSACPVALAGPMPGEYASAARL
jgi:hypothetical protein